MKCREVPEDAEDRPHLGPQTIHHEGTVTAGHMHVRHDDATEIEIGPGDAYVIEPGHDVWVTGSEVFVATNSTATPPRPSLVADQRERRR
jgi:hypothetical protein